MNEKEKNEEQIDLKVYQEMQELKKEYKDIEEKSKHELEKVKEEYERKLKATKEKIIETVKDPKKMLAFIAIIGTMITTIEVQSKELKSIDPTYAHLSEPAVMAKSDRVVDLNSYEEIELENGIRASIKRDSLNIEKPEIDVNKYDAVEILSDEELDRLKDEGIEVSEGDTVTKLGNGIIAVTKAEAIKDKMEPTYSTSKSLDKVEVMSDEELDIISLENGIKAVTKSKKDEKIKDNSDKAVEILSEEEIAKIEEENGIKLSEYDSVKKLSNGIVVVTKKQIKKDYIEPTYKNISEQEVHEVASEESKQNGIQKMSDKELDDMVR